MEKHPEAIVVLHQVPELESDRHRCAESRCRGRYRQSGQAAKADSIDQAMVAEFSSMNYDSLSTGDLMAVGVSMFNAKKYQEAADVFEKVCGRKNPWSRDAVYNLANTYLALQNWPKLVEVGHQLAMIEPLNEDAYRLTGQAFRELKQQDSLLKEAETAGGTAGRDRGHHLRDGDDGRRASKRPPPDARRPMRAGRT